MSDWISVEERLPSEMQAVIGLFEYQCCAIVAFDGDAFVQDTTQAELYSAEPLSGIAEQPTHWMPLPAAPKPERG